MLLMNLKPNLTLVTKIYSKWTIELNLKYKTVKFPKDTIGENLNDFGYSADL